MRISLTFEKNTYMYKSEERKLLNVFRIKHAEGSILDISDPTHVIRGDFVIND